VSAAGVVPVCAGGGGGGVCAGARDGLVSAAPAKKAATSDRGRRKSIKHR
jgi:hypothetical protein